MVERTATETDDSVVRIRVARLIALAHSAHSLTLRNDPVKSKRTDARRAPFKGRGMEYNESRIYQHGDDVRHLDWRVTARTGEAHTKVFCEERERPLFLCVDLRSPMRFATHGKFKSVIAAEVASLLAWCATHEGDKVGGIVLGDNGHTEIKPARGKNGCLNLIHQLATTDDRSARPDDNHPRNEEAANDKTNSNSNLFSALLALNRIAHTGSLAFIISDMHDLNEAATAQFAQLARHTELVLIQILDPLEQTLPPPNYYVVGQGGEESAFSSADKRFAEAYHRNVEKQKQRLRGITRRARAQFIECPTDIDPLEGLRKAFGN